MPFFATATTASTIPFLSVSVDSSASMSRLFVAVPINATRSGRELIGDTTRFPVAVPDVTPKSERKIDCAWATSAALSSMASNSRSSVGDEKFRFIDMIQASFESKITHFSCVYVYAELDQTAVPALIPLNALNAVVLDVLFVVDPSSTILTS